MAYNKIGFKDRIDSKPESYLVNGTETTIIKDDSGLINKGTNLNKTTFDHIENGIYQNSIDIANVNNTVTNNKEELDTFKTETELQLADVAKFDRKTYAELKTLKDSNQLKEGKRYILTDYRTKYKQPDTNIIKEMEAEELILTASSTNTFEPIVFSFKYPQDTIWYDFDDELCEDKRTPRNGFITRRHDTVDGNNCPQDWRTMLWARWKPDTQQYYKNDVLTNYEVWTSGNAKMGVIYKAGDKLLVAHNTNVPSKPDDINVFYVVYNDINVGMLLSDKVEIPSRTVDKLELKKGELHERLTFGDNCTRNSIGLVITPHNNVFGNNCNSNSLGNTSYKNSFGDDCNYNSFGNNCIFNSFGNNCYSNSFGNGCGYNRFGNSCDRNSFGNSCRNNSFEYNSDGNSFGNSCDSNSFGNYCNFNRFGNDLSGNNFNDNCRNLCVKSLHDKSMKNLDIYSKTYTITIDKNSNNKYVYWYLDGNNQLVYELIP